MVRLVGRRVVRLGRGQICLLGLVCQTLGDYRGGCGGDRQVRDRGDGREDLDRLGRGQRRREGLVGLGVEDGVAGFCVEEGLGVAGFRVKGLRVEGREHCGTGDQGTRTIEIWGLKN